MPKEHVIPSRLILTNLCERIFKYFSYILLPTTHTYIFVNKQLAEFNFFGRHIYIFLLNDLDHNLKYQKQLFNILELKKYILKIV